MPERNRIVRVNALLASLFVVALLTLLTTVSRAQESAPAGGIAPVTARRRRADQQPVRREPRRIRRHQAYRRRRHLHARGRPAGRRRRRRSRSGLPAGQGMVAVRGVVLEADLAAMDPRATLALLALRVVREANGLTLRRNRVPFLPVRELDVAAPVLLALPRALLAGLPLLARVRGRSLRRGGPR